MPSLLFDLDDTLLVTYEAHHAAMDACVARLQATHPGVDGDDLKHRATRIHIDVEEEMEFGRVTFANQREFRTRVWTDLLGELEHPTERALEFADLYQSERTARYRLFDDVESVLDELSQRYDLVLVTNGMSDLQRHKIDLMRLERWFPHMLVSGEVGSWKPHPDIFLEALRRTGASPREAVMVGDSQPRDVSGARGVGIRAIWLKRYAHQQHDPAHPNDAVAESLRTVANLADGWLAPRT